MSGSRVFSTAALAGVLSALAIAGCGGGDPGTDPAPVQPTTAGSGASESADGVAGAARDQPADNKQEEAPGEPDSADAARLRLQRRATQVYEDYIEAINDADGVGICELLATGTERQLELPVRGGACAERVSGSIGFRDPRGFPVWKETVLSGLESVDVSGSPIRVTASIVTFFADRDEPSVESDIAYIGRGSGGSYVLLKPSTALYRAVGEAELPPDVISPP